MRERLDEAFDAFLLLGDSFRAIAEAAITLLIYTTFPLWVFPYILFRKEQDPGNEEERK